MANSIAKASLLLGANASALYTGLTDAAAKTTSWAKGVGSTISGAFSKLRGVGSGLLKNSAFQVLGKGLQTNITTAFANVQGAVLAGLGVGTDWIKDAISKIKELADVGLQAKSIGILSDDFMALRNNAKRFKLEGDDLIKVLVKFNAESSKGLPGLAHPMPRMEIPEIGGIKIDLKDKGVQARLTALAVKLQGIKDPAEQARVATEAFGAGGAALVPKLAKGERAVAELARQTGRIGAVRLNVDDAGVQAKLRETAAKLDGVKDPAERARIATEAFGGAASALLPNLEKGGKGVDEIIRKFGEQKPVPAISAQGIADKSLIERLKLAADQVERIKNPADQARLAIEMFGKAGIKMLPFLQQGSKGIEEFAAKQAKLGLLVKPDDMEKLIEAKSALPKIDTMFEGFKQQLVVGFAPVILEFAKSFQNVLPPIQAILDVVVRGMSTYFAVLAQFWAEVFEWGQKVINIVIEFAKSWNILPETLPSIEEIVVFTLKHIAKGIAYTLDTMKSQIAVVLMNIGFLAEKAGSIASYFGASWGGKVEEAGQAMRKWSVETVRNWGSSAKVVDEFFDRFANRNAKMGEEAVKTASEIQAQYHAVGSAIQGSKEALSIQAKFETQQMMINPAVQVAKDQLAEQKKTNKILEDLRQGPRREKEEFAVI